MQHKTNSSMFERMNSGMFECILNCRDEIYERSLWKIIDACRKFLNVQGIAKNGIKSTVYK